jgi:hypothetical protein
MKVLRPLGDGKRRAERDEYSQTALLDTSIHKPKNSQAVTF